MSRAQKTSSHAPSRSAFEVCGHEADVLTGDGIDQIAYSPLDLAFQRMQDIPYARMTLMMEKIPYLPDTSQAKPLYRQDVLLAEVEVDQTFDRL